MAATQNKRTRPVRIPAGEVSLSGDMVIPPGTYGEAPYGIVLFAHGSGSSRRSPRNRYVAGVLQDAGLATLLFDLLTEDEETEDQWSGHLRFDVDLLARRLLSATDFVRREPDTQGMRVGYFGASTGAAAALIAAAARPDQIGAVVSRGGRPDLAGEALSRVTAPTLLIVGGDDIPVLGMNRAALARLRTVKDLYVVPGATHLFEEPGALEDAALAARRWFEEHLVEVHEPRPAY